MKFQRTIPVVLAGTILAAFSSGAYAGQKYTVGLNTDVTTGANGPVAPAVPATGTSYTGSYGSYPSLDFNAHGQRSTFESTYAFGYNREYSGTSEETHSHAASLRFASPFGPKWDFNISDSFEQTANSSTFQLFRGDTTIPKEFRFIFDPVLSSSRRTDTASFGLSRKLNDKSNLTFGGSYSVLDYFGVAQFAGVLTNQQRESVNVEYSHALARGSWNLSYSGSQFDFDAFQKARTTAITLGYSHQLSRTVSLQISGGPNYLETKEIVKNRVGANASIGLQRSIKSGGLSIAYSQNSADSSGLGSISSNQQVTLGMSHVLGRRFTVSADVTGFDTRGKTAAALSNRGGSAGGSMGYLMGKRLSMNWGGQYQKYAGNSQFALNQKRIFVSLRFHNPEFWRF